MGESWRIMDTEQGDTDSIPMRLQKFNKAFNGEKYSKIPEQTPKLQTAKTDGRKKAKV